MFPITIKGKVYLVIFSHKNIQSISLLYVATSFTSAFLTTKCTFFPNEWVPLFEKILQELFERPDREDVGVPLVVTYHSRFHNLSNNTRNILDFFMLKKKSRELLHLFHLPHFVLVTV